MGRLRSRAWCLVALASRQSIGRAELRAAPECGAAPTARPGDSA